MHGRFALRRSRLPSLVLVGRAIIEPRQAISRVAQSCLLPTVPEFPAVSCTVLASRLPARYRNGCLEIAKVGVTLRVTLPSSRGA